MHILAAFPLAALTIPSAPTYFLGFGIVSIVLGALGMIRAKSKASLIAGGLSGVLLLVAWWLLKEGNPAGKWVALAVSGLLTLRFLPAFLAKKQLYPAGIMALLSIIGAVLAVMIVL